MDPIICCLLGICCPPQERRETLIAHLEALGAAPLAAESIAADLIMRVDETLNHGNLVSMIATAARNHRKE